MSRDATFPATTEATPLRDKLRESLRPVTWLQSLTQGKNRTTSAWLGRDFYVTSVAQLPYGTMQDDEMLKLDVPSLQDEGFIFLWVTGR